MYMYIIYGLLTRVDWTVFDRRAHGRIERVRLEGRISTGPHGPTQQGVLLCSPQGGRPRHTEPRQVVGGGAPCLYGCPVLSQKLFDLFSLHLCDMVVGRISKLGTDLWQRECKFVYEQGLINTLVHYIGFFCLVHYPLSLSAPSLSLSLSLSPSPSPSLPPSPRLIFLSLSPAFNIQLVLQSVLQEHPGCRSNRTHV